MVHQQNVRQEDFRFQNVRLQKSKMSQQGKGLPTEST